MAKIEDITQTELKSLQDDVDYMMNIYINEQGLTDIGINEHLWDTISMSMQTKWNNDDLVDDAVAYLVNRYPAVNFIDDRN